MRNKWNIFNKIKKVPKGVYLITLFSFSFPFLIEDSFIVHDLQHMEFFLFLIPTFFWSYYLGLVGGINGAIIANTLLLGNEWIEIKYFDIVYKTQELYIIFVIVTINLAISIGIGYLADKLIKRKEVIEQIAITDPITQLFNRRYIINQLNTIHNEANLAVIYIDLDHFKYINDSLGHDVGDMLLQKVGNRLKEIVNEETVARIGGDEFIILFTKNTEEDDLDRISSRILKSISEPFLIYEQNIFITASMGICIYPKHTDRIDKLLKSADIAMYHAKSLGKNQVQYYNQSLETKFFEDARMEQDIRCALENQEFTIYYQPKFKIKNQQIIGSEALIRWQHPRYGLLSPNIFIPTAERTNLIVLIGEWVIQQVCLQIKDWQDKGLHILPISINVSARQFNLTFVDFIEKTLSETKINPSLIQIEITESILMNDFNQAKKILEQINQLGIYIAIDDFGTGYSSLSYLDKLPVHCLKIDKSFFNDTDNAMAIIDTIITLGHHLRFDVLAEGIETKEQLDNLRESNCDFGQGYLISPPITARRFEQLFIATSNHSENASICSYASSI